MRRNWVKIVFGLAMGFLLVGCGNSQVSDKQLKEDILSLQEVVGNGAQVETLTIIEKTVESDTEVLKVNVIIDYHDYVMTLDLQMKYEKTGNKWLLKDHEVTILKVVPKTEPTMTEDLKGAIMPTSYDLVPHEWISEAPVYTIISKETDLEHATSTIIIEENVTVQTYSVRVTYTVLGTYDRHNGWQYELIDWQYLDTMDWNGIYDLEVTVETSQYPGPHSYSVYKTGDRIEGIEITGTKSSRKSMEDPNVRTFESTVRIRYTFDGQAYDVTPSDFGLPTYFIIKPTTNPYSAISFNFQIETYDQAHLPHFYAGAGEFECTLTKRP